MRTTANRVLLGLIGLVLLVLGLSVLVGSLDLQRHWGFTVPGWWPFTGPHDVLLTEHSRTRYRSDGWWWPVVFAVLGVLLLGSLWWLLAQARTRRLRQIRVDSGDGQGALLRGRALESVLANEAAGQEGVQRAHVHLTGRRSTPQTRVRLLLAPHVNPGTALNDLTDQALAHARNSAGLASLPAEVRLKGVKHGAERVS